MRLLRRPFQQTDSSSRYTHERSSVRYFKIDSRPCATDHRKVSRAPLTVACILRVLRFSERRKQLLLDRDVLHLLHFSGREKSVAPGKWPEFFIQVGELSLIIFNVFVGSFAVVLGRHLRCGCDLDAGATAADVI